MTKPRASLQLVVFHLGVRRNFEFSVFSLHLHSQPYNRGEMVKVVYDTRVLLLALMHPFS
jgi:hypothetical protein